MESYSEFLVDFLSPFFGGIVDILKAFFQGLFRMFNLFNYVDIILESKFTGIGVLVVILSSIFLLIMFFALFYLIYFCIRRYIKYRKNYKKEEQLIDEIENLNNDILKLKTQNEKMKELAGEDGEIELDENGNPINKLKNGESRFFKLTEVDSLYEGKEMKVITNNFNLKDFCDNFRNYSANKLKLYYDDKTIRLFIAALSSNRMIILEGISGTGKTSLAYAFGKMVMNETTVASVQPSWRDSTEIFGYFNEFTKKFNETDILRSMYLAAYTDNVYITLLDEMNISRVEYYFAEMLSILELPSKDERKVEIVSNSWENDPKLLEAGKVNVPDNMWFVGTINNDDSTFMVSDKVYDRAMPIAIDTRFKAFDAPETEPIEVSYTYLNNLFITEREKHPVSKEVLDKLGELEGYIIEHFRIAFGNRIMKQLNDFVPIFVACGGEELEAIDYIVAHKILRKFEQLNLAYVKGEIDDFIEYLNKLFGKNAMKECESYLNRIKKMM